MAAAFRVGIVRDVLNDRSDRAMVEMISTLVMVSSVVRNLEGGDR